MDQTPTGQQTAGDTAADADAPTGDAARGILGIGADTIAARALVVGDPDRVAEVAERLDDPVLLGRSREYVTLGGSYRGVGVTVASHGVGVSGAAICFEELARAGVRRFVRAGTCGGLQPHVIDGDLVVATAAVRDDGFTDRLLPSSWPAVADPALCLDLAARAAATDLRSHTGIVHTAANFHPSPVLDEPGWRIFHRAGALAIEMELAALLVIAQLHGAAAGGIFAVDGNLLTAAGDMADYDPDRDVVRRAKAAMLPLALDALTSDAR